MAGIREDVKYAAYAVSLGYTIGGRWGNDLREESFVGGVPSNSLTFCRPIAEGCSAEVWDTASGWRVGVRGIDGMMAKPVDSDFHKHLVPALEAGAKI